MLISTLKWPELADDRAVLHQFEVVAVDDVHIAGDGAEDIANAGGFGHRHHPEAVHHRFQSRQRVDFGDDYIRAHAARAAGQPAPAPAVTGHDKVLACQQHVGGADDTIQRGLAGTVAVIEEVLGHWHR